jgi:hypothetical protein
MRIPIKSSLLTATAMLMLTAFGTQLASAQHHHGAHRYHVWRNERWTWENHPSGWVAPAYTVGPAQVDINLGWGSHPGWQRYHVYRNNSWGYVYHPAGWTVPGAWRGPHGHRR